MDINRQYQTQAKITEWNRILLSCGAAAGVAGPRALLVDIEEEGILVAVGADFLENLRVPGGGSLVPDFFSTT